MARVKHRLTITQLKEFAGYESITEKDAANIIASLEKLSVIFFELYQKKQKELEKIADSEFNRGANINSKTVNINGRKRKAA